MRRDGTSLAEALLALLLGGLILQLGWTVLTTQRRVVDGMVRGAEAAGAARLVGAVLRTELRTGRPGADWIVGRDSIRVRTFRGTGAPCGPPAPDGVPLRFRGWFRPDPGVDSVLILGAGGRWRASALVALAASPDPCSPPEPGAPGQRWRLEPGPVHRPVLLRLFRSGSYHLTGRAFRHRRGLGGRQPLTPRVLDDPGSSLRGGPGGEVRVKLRFDGLPRVPGRNPVVLSFWPAGG